MSPLAHISETVSRFLKPAKSRHLPSASEQQRIPVMEFFGNPEIVPLENIQQAIAKSEKEARQQRILNNNKSHDFTSPIGDQAFVRVKPQPPVARPAPQRFKLDKIRLGRARDVGLITLFGAAAVIEPNPVVGYIAAGVIGLSIEDLRKHWNDSEPVDIAERIYALNHPLHPDNIKPVPSWFEKLRTALTPSFSFKNFAATARSRIADIHGKYLTVPATATTGLAGNELAAEMPFAPNLLNLRQVTFRENSASSASETKPEMIVSQISQAEQPPETQDNIFTRNLPAKGMLKSVFTKSALVGITLTGAKIAARHSLRTVDHSGAITAGVVGVLTTGGFAYSDYRKARKAEEGREQLKRIEALRSIWTKDNRKKYAIAFGTSAAASFAASWGAGWFADRIANLTPEAIELPVLPATPETLLDSHRMASSVMPMPEIPVDAITPDIAHMLSVYDHIAALAGDQTLNAAARETATQALTHDWAAGNVAYGLANGINGFTKDLAGAAKIFSELAAKGDKNAMLNYAYMQYHGLGTQMNRGAARAVIRTLGRSWPRGEALLTPELMTG